MLKFKEYVLRYALAALTILALAGCATVGPDYVRPEISVSKTWHTELRGGLSYKEINSQTEVHWWTTLNDPVLTSLIERSVKKNLSLQTALARVREARARRGIVESDLFPSFDFKGSAAWSRDNKVKETTEHYSARIDSSWELDFFGGNQRSLEASQADLEARHADLDDVLISLQAEVALNYIEVRTFQRRLEIAEANLSIQKEAYQLASWRHQAGLSDELALQQALYNLENTHSQIPTLKTGVEEAMNRIAVLIGEQPGSVHHELKDPKPVFTPTLEIAVGIPADLLGRRPDVRSAERALAAQTARVGAAKAELYPKISLSGSIGLESLSLNSLVSSATKSITGGSLITMPIFRSGAIRQNIKVQTALQEQALIKYEAAVLNALEEVENALTSYSHEQIRKEALQEAENAATKAADLAMHKYTGGLRDFGDVLESQRSLLSFQDQLAQSEGIIVINLIKLYKALGGGWQSMYSNDKKTAFEMERGDETD